MKIALQLVKILPMVQNVAAKLLTSIRYRRHIMLKITTYNYQYTGRLIFYP